MLIIENWTFFSSTAWLPKRPILGRNRNLKGSPCLLSIYSLRLNLFCLFCFSQFMLILITGAEFDNIRPRQNTNQLIVLTVSKGTYLVFNESLIPAYWEILNVNGNYKIGLLWPFSPANRFSSPQKRFLKKQYGVSKTLNCLEECLNSLKKLREMQTKYIMGDHLCMLLLS